MAVHGVDRDRGAAVACRPAVRALRGQSGPGCPHFLFPLIPRALPAIAGEIAFGAPGQDAAPGAVEGGARLLEINRRSAGGDAAIGRGLEAVIPTPLVDGAGYAGALADRAYELWGGFQRLLSTRGSLH